MTGYTKRLLGAWSLVEWTINFEDGRPPVNPFGEGAIGRIHYASDGIMNATIMGADRKAGDKAALYTSYMHYTGRWRLDGDVVHHVVDFALDPRLIGQDLARTVTFEGDDLVLAGDNLSPRTGLPVYQTLRWRRV